MSKSQTKDDQFDSWTTAERITATVMTTAWIVMALSIAWMAGGIFLGIPAMFFASFFTFSGTAISVFLIKVGYSVAGRLAWFVSGLVTVVFGYFIVHPLGTVEVMFAALVGGPFLTFSLYRERFIIVSLTGLILVTWIVVTIMGHDFFGPPIIGPEIAQKYISTAAMATTLVVVGIEMSMFSIITQQTTEHMRRSRHSARNANRAKSEFLATMSHEIRTPMNGILGMVEILGTTELDSEQKRILHTVQESSFSLLRIIEDILDMSKIEAGSLKLLEERTELLNTIEGAVETLRSYADANNVRLALGVRPDVPETIFTDPGRLRQILLNLLSNAIKFSRRDAGERPGEVHFWATRSANNELVLTFRDNGIGIDPEFQSRLFEPFHQSEYVTTRRFGGSGLGLSIVQQLVTKMGGSIAVESELGKGAKFTVTLPMRNPRGKLFIPDMSGWTSYALGTPYLDKDGLRSYTHAANADLCVLEDEQGMYEAAKLGINKKLFIFVTTVFDDCTELSSVAAFRKIFPTASCLVMTLRRTEKTGYFGDGLGVVQAAPLLPSDLWNVVSAIRDHGDSAIEVKYSKPAKERPEAAVASGLRILVAEDNEINQEVIRRQLQNLGYSPEIQANGRLALEAWQAGEYDLILTDCHMPDMDGFEFAEQVRAIETARGLPRIPIVAVTANALAGEGARCLAHGMDAYLTKPLKLVDLKEAITLHTSDASAES